MFSGEIGTHAGGSKMARNGEIRFGGNYIMFLFIPSGHESRIDILFKTEWKSIAMVIYNINWIYIYYNKISICKYSKENSEYISVGC